MIIAVFRYVFVFHPQAVISEHQRRRFQLKCLLYLFGSCIFTTFFSLIFSTRSKRYPRCMGKEETFFFNIPFFLEERVGSGHIMLPFWHPLHLIFCFIYTCYIFIVPFVYMKIFRFRGKRGVTGISEEQKLFWKRRNIVSTWYNMAVWLSEGIVSILVSYNLNNTQMFQE